MRKAPISSSQIPALGSATDADRYHPARCLYGSWCGDGDYAERASTLRGSAEWGEGDSLPEIAPICRILLNGNSRARERLEVEERQRLEGEAERLRSTRNSHPPGGEDYLPGRQPSTTGVCHRSHQTKFEP